MDKPAQEALSIRVTSDVKVLLDGIIERVNRKDLGRKAKGSDIIALALSLIADDHVKVLQESSLSNSDKLELKYREFVKQHGTVSKDDFLGTLIKD